MTEISIGIKDLREQVKALQEVQYGRMKQKNRGTLDGLLDLCNEIIAQAEAGKTEITIPLYSEEKPEEKAAHIAILVSGGCVQEVVSDIPLTYTIVDEDAQDDADLPLTTFEADKILPETDIERIKESGEWLDIPVGSGG